ncbi:MAG: shikimate kinase [Gemmatimonadetes bacterium]|nr:shikimate kinase [Gemmatimonadota bacterium]
MTGPARRHVVLVGLPGAGKTTIGRLVAAALGAPFVDLDDAVERRSGKAISQVFAQDGEGGFRTLERAEMEAALLTPSCVIAAGGGWAAQPGNLEAVSGRALTVYLSVAPEVASRRARPNAGSRPLLAGGDLATRLGQLLWARRSFYERCDVTVPADRDDPAAVAREVCNLARSLAGWY